MRVFIEDILRVKRTFEPFLEKIHAQSRYLDNNETAQVVYDRRLNHISVHSLMND